MEDDLLKEILILLKQQKKNDDHVLSKHLKSFNDSTFMRACNTATTIGGLVALILGAGLLDDKLNLSKQTIKRIKEATIFSIIGCLSFAWLFIGFYQWLSNKKNQPTHQEPENKPPDTNLSNTNLPKGCPTCGHLV
jgi:hypothetical protein